MSRNMEFPEGEAISELLGMLVGRKVTCKRGREVSPSTSDLGAQGVYVFDDGSIAAVILCDLSFSGSAGAALSMLNANEVREALKTKRLSESVRENLQEVLNIGASWFNAPYKPHVKFRELSLAPNGLPEDAEGAVFDFEQRIDLSVEIAGYPAGNISIFEAA